jgi:hypothetical protein
LARAKHRTKREMARLVRELDPLPDVPARIEPLGPVVKGAGRVSHEKTMLALYPVRHLPPGERPRDWMEPELAAELAGVGGAPTEQSDEPAPARNEAGAVTGPQRFMVQFTATPEHAELVERAQALLSGTPGGASLAAVHLRALRELVSRLETQKYGAARSRPGKTAPHEAPAPSPSAAPVQAAPAQVPRQRGGQHRGRYIPAPIRREVFERDAGRCTYVESTGQRCRETHCLEMHHLQAFGLGGEHEVVNLTLRCRAHNALAAEEDFGRAFVEEKRTTRHESFSRAATDAKADSG